VRDARVAVAAARAVVAFPVFAVDFAAGFVALVAASPAVVAVVGLAAVSFLVFVATFAAVSVAVFRPAVVVAGR
jgi:hypothetical protein